MRRRYVTADRLRELQERLSERDQAVVREVAALRFVSGGQLGRLCFMGSDNRGARRGLLKLTRLDVLERLPRPVGGVRAGSAGFIYCLGPAGQKLAMESGWLVQRRTRQPRVPGLLFVRHALAVTELHTRLVEAARQGYFELLKRTAEPSCWRQAGGVVLKPDSYVRFGIGDFEDSYFIEVDRGTEGSKAITRQLERYVAYHRTGHEQTERGVFPMTLWLVSDSHRGEAIAELIRRLPKPERELFALTHFDGALQHFLDAHNK